jgi:S-adenosylhomocysteine hydrolase
MNIELSNKIVLVSRVAGFIGSNLCEALIKNENKVYVLPKYLDEKVAKLNLKRLVVELEEINKDQADYTGVKVEGLYKPNYYRY